jgi:hypothetical protein
MVHSQNPHLAGFFPLVVKTLSRGAEALQNGQNEYTASEIERYALNIFSRVFAIDNAFKNIELTLEYLQRKSYQNTRFEYSEHHTFHVENFLLRITSIVDRCYLLAGSTMLMASNKIEKLGGNKLIMKELKNFSPSSAEIICKMDETISSLKKERNIVAHQNGFHSKNLSVIEAIENAELASHVEQITDIVPLEKIKDILIDDSVGKFKEITNIIDKLVCELINSFSFAYKGLLECT